MQSHEYISRHWHTTAQTMRSNSYSQIFVSHYVIRNHYSPLFLPKRPQSVDMHSSYSNFNTPRPVQTNKTLQSFRNQGNLYVKRRKTKRSCHSPYRVPGLLHVMDEILLYLLLYRFAWPSNGYHLLFGTPVGSVWWGMVSEIICVERCHGSFHYRVGWEGGDSYRCSIFQNDVAVCCVSRPIQEIRRGKTYSAWMIPGI